MRSEKEREVDEKSQRQGDDNEGRMRCGAQGGSDPDRRFEDQGCDDAGEQGVGEQFAAADGQVQEVLERASGEIREDQRPGLSVVPALSLWQ